MNRFDSFLKAPTWFSGLLLAILVAACSQVGSDQNAGQTAALSSEPPRGTEQSFAVLGGSTVTNTGTSVITGNLGVNPGTAVTGFPPGIVTGVTHAADAESLQAQTDTTVMYDNVAGQACTSDLTGQDLGGKSLVPGVYCFSSSAGLTGQLTLDAAGVADAVWVFQTASTLTTASNSSVLLINGANPCNVFWKVGSSATLGTNSAFVGTLLALTSITLTTGANVSGRVLARNGAVTLDSNTITVPVCDVPVSSIPPKLDKSFSPGTINPGGVSTLTITLGNANDTPANLAGPLIDALPSGLVVVPGSVSTTCIETPRPLSGWFIVDTASVGLTAEGLIPANGSCTVTAEVTAAAAGTYVNTLPAGALQTDHGNNAGPAVATLTVL
ncbi:MAG TPA: ice-binding family protein [Burkholderiales bacterium]|nr:ice-binding family protein [Burkholderiales bacterium]